MPAIHPMDARARLASIGWLGTRRIGGSDPPEDAQCSPKINYSQTCLINRVI